MTYRCGVIIVQIVPRGKAQSRNAKHIHKSRTTPYHPLCDGLVERLNRTLINMLATTVHEHSGDWDRHLRQLCMAYNTSVQSSTGFTRFYLMFGRQAKLPVDIVHRSPPTEPLPCHEYAQSLRSRLEVAYSKVKEHSALLFIGRKNCTILKYTGRNSRWEIWFGSIIQSWLGEHHGNCTAPGADPIQ